MKNRLRETYAQGVPCIGTFLQMGSPEVAECAGLAGFDFFIVDTEHSPYDLPQITACCRAAASVRSPGAPCSRRWMPGQRV